MCSDSRFGPMPHRSSSDDRRTGAGRVVPLWTAIHALALAAHQVFADRLLIAGIALTRTAGADRGHSYPDTEFLQRVHDQPIGASPLVVLAHHLDH